MEQQYLAGGPYLDYTEAVGTLLPPAERGDADAQYNLGVAYLRGLGVSKDAVTGLTWLRKAADQGHIRATHHLGYAYLIGDSAPRDLVAACTWLTIANAAGYRDENTEVVAALLTEAQNEKVRQDELAWYRTHPAVPPFARTLGFAYVSGNGIEKSYAEAAPWFLRAAQAGDALSAYMIAVMYVEGDGVKKDEHAALEWYRAGARGGVVGAMNGLAYLEATSEDPAVRNPVDAIEWAGRAVQEQRSADYLNTLAEAYFASGNAEKAMVTEKEALAMKPGDSFQKQLDRFERAQKER